MLFLKFSSASVLPRVNKDGKPWSEKAAHQVLLDGNTRVTVWPRDGAAAVKALATGEIMVRPGAQIRMRDGKPVMDATGTNPVIDVQYTFVPSVESVSLESLAIDPAAAKAATEASEPALPA